MNREEFRNSLNRLQLKGKILETLGSLKSLKQHVKFDNESTIESI